MTFLALIAVLVVEVKVGIHVVWALKALLATVLPIHLMAKHQGFQAVEALVPVVDVEEEVVSEELAWVGVEDALHMAYTNAFVDIDDD